MNMNRHTRKPRKQETATPFPPVQDDTLQHGNAVPQQTIHEVPPIVQEVLSSSGQPLDAETQIFMESRFGHDFSQVRVHTDERAVESAQEVNALAYTVGKDIVFGEEQYAPGKSEGKSLVAHELTHVVQQDNGAPQTNRVLSHTNDASEVEASHIGIALLAPFHASSPHLALGEVPVGLVQRQEKVKSSKKEVPVEKGSPTSEKETLKELGSAYTSVLKRVKEYAEVVKMGHHLGFLGFKDWYGNYKKERKQGVIILHLLEFVFKIFLMSFLPEEAFLLEILDSIVKVIASSWESTETEDLNLFFNVLEKNEQKVINKLVLDASQEFRKRRADTLQKAARELITQREHGWSEIQGKEIPDSVERILQAAGVGNPDSTTELKLAERWLASHIQSVLLLDRHLSIATGNVEIRIVSEISALRVIDPDHTQKQVYQLEKSLHPFFRSVCNINEDSASILYIKLHIDAKQAQKIVESRESMGPFKSAEELVTRGILTRDEYEREIPPEYSHPGQQLRVKHLMVVA